MSTDTWADYELIEDNTRVELTHVDEGYNGDYNADDPDDKPLVRFYVQRKNLESGWEDVDDASYCTNVPTTITVEQRETMARIIMGNVAGHLNIKKICEELSWLNESDLAADEVDNIGMIPPKF